MGVSVRKMCSSVPHPTPTHTYEPILLFYDPLQRWNRSGFFLTGNGTGRISRTGRYTGMADSSVFDTLQIDQLLH
jgi:hypothetical protein